MVKRKHGRHGIRCIRFDGDKVYCGTTGEILGELIAEETRHFKRKKKGHKTRKQAIAIAFSKARAAGLKVPKVGGSKRVKTTKRRKKRRRKG